MSLRQVIYDSVKAKLNSPDKGIGWIDLWKAQVTTQSDPKKGYPFNFPASFVSIGVPQWEDMTGDAKEGKLLISIYIFFDKYGDTFDGASDEATSLQIMDTVENVHKDLHWIEESPFKELTLISDEDMTERYERPAFKLTFETIVYIKVR